MRFKMGFQVICFVLAMYMCASFVKRFTENDNATSITYRRFNNMPKDEYPTFSVCFEGTPFHWFHDLDVYKSFELRAEKYELMLKGSPAFRYQYDPSMKLFRKSPTFVSNGTNDEYKDFHVQLSDFLLEANFTSLKKSDSRFFTKIDELTLNDQPLTISYHTPDIICFARDSTYVPNLIRTEDLLSLDKMLMDNIMYKDTEIQIFIHHPGQLIRSLAIPSFTSSFQDYQHNKQLSFKMAQSTVIRKRSDYREPCTGSIKDYDKYLMNVVINETKCIPPYWKEMVQDTPGLAVCTSQEQLEIVYENIRDWRNVMEHHESPCVDMFNIAGWNWLDIEGAKNSNENQIKFNYQDQYYQELEYLPDFDGETFISNIGGFVGIFLGYSLMQFPELLGKFSLTSEYSKSIPFVTN